MLSWRLSEFADFAQSLFVDNLDAAAVDRDDFFVGETRQGTDGIRGGHVREVGQVFTGHVDVEGEPVFLDTVVLFEY